MEFGDRSWGWGGMRKEVLGELSRLDPGEGCSGSGWMKRLDAAWEGLIG